jgi:ATP synthase F1 gamma subunit
MSAINELKETLEHTQTASFVTTMLRDISATKLQSIRAQFDANHAYFLELHELMALVQAYGEKYAKLHKSTEAGKRVYVAVTSNKRFYGMLNMQVMNTLRKAVEQDPAADFLVIGQTGKQIYELSPFSKKAQFFAFLSDDPDDAQMLTCVEMLTAYSEILVVHPTFVNSFTQQAKTTDVTHVPEPSEMQKETAGIDYLFEPDIPKMLEFFTTQIRLVLFSRVILETKLALTGARLMKMQRAREKAEELLKEQRRVIHKEISTVQSMRLLETFAGFKSKDVNI